MVGIAVSRVAPQRFPEPLAVAKPSFRKRFQSTPTVTLLCMSVVVNGVTRSVAQYFPLSLQLKLLPQMAEVLMEVSLSLRKISSNQLSK